jgi:hypothetical protein
MSRKKKRHALLKRLELKPLPESLQAAFSEIEHPARQHAPETRAVARRTAQGRGMN